MSKFAEIGWPGVNAICLQCRMTLSSCHLGPLAGWPDTVRFLYPWSSHLHYVNPVNDEPPKHCTYGEDGWQDKGTGNVLDGE